MDDTTLFVDAPAFEITKTYRDDDGQMFVEGIASTVDVDLTNERMSPEAIAKMAARAVGVPLRSEHGKGWDDKLGEIVKADVVSDDAGRPALWIKARLYDWSSKAKDLFALLQKGAQMGLSVAGKIRSGGIVKELADNLGKYIPTYKDIELTEVSVTDHPANLGAFDLAIAKSMQAYADKQELAKADDDPNVPQDHFLDPANRRFRADDKFLLPCMRYFNQPDQREHEGYASDQWAQMGSQLADRLSQVTKATYAYDPDHECVTPTSTTKTNDGEGVTTMKQDSNLVSKAVSNDVASFVKQFNRDIKKELGQDDATVQKTDATNGEAEKSSSSSDSTSTGSTSTDSGSTSSTSTGVLPTLGASSSTDSSDSSSTDSSATSTDKGDSTDSTISSLLSEISSSLSNLKSSLSSTSSDDSSSSDASSTGSSSDSSDSTSTDKGASTTGSSATSLEECMRAIGDNLNTMNELMAKKKAPMTPVPTSTEAETATATSKALADLLEEIRELKKSHAAVLEKIEAQPLPRKGVARDIPALEKSFDGYQPTEMNFDADLYAKIAADKEIGFKEQMAYKEYGFVPAKYKTEAKN